MDQAAAKNLSRRQLEFAERVHCSTAIAGVNQAACLYRELQHETIRWIVDPDGCVLDWTVFRTHSLTGR